MIHYLKEEKENEWLAFQEWIIHINTHIKNLHPCTQCKICAFNIWRRGEKNPLPIKMGSIMQRTFSAEHYISIKCTNIRQAADAPCPVGTMVISRSPWGDVCMGERGVSLHPFSPIWQLPLLKSHKSSSALLCVSLRRLITLHWSALNAVLHLLSFQRELAHGIHLFSSCSVSLCHLVPSFICFLNFISFLFSSSSSFSDKGLWFLTLNGGYINGV